VKNDGTGGKTSAGAGCPGKQLGACPIDYDREIPFCRVAWDCFFEITFPIAILDKNFDFVIVNEAYAALDECDPSFFPGKNHFDLYPSDAKEIFERVVKTGEPYQTYAHPFIYANNPERGTTYWNYRIQPLVSSSGSVEYLALSLNDVTLLKRTQKEIQRLDKLNLIGQMAASIGHEIRNPLTTVRGFLQLFKSKKEYKTHENYFSTMISELDRANSILTEFLSLARNNETVLKLQDLNPIIEQIYPLLKAEAMLEEKQVVFSPGDPAQIELDEKEVRQLVINLAKNGLEAMDPGGRLTIATGLSEGRVVLTVQDQGSGIDPSIVEMLGTPFVTTKEKGTGLGFAVCYQIVENHGAEMDINTGPGGTCISVSFKIPTRNAQ